MWERRTEAQKSSPMAKIGSMVLGNQQQAPSPPGKKFVTSLADSLSPQQGPVQSPGRKRIFGHEKALKMHAVHKSG